MPTKSEYVAGFLSAGTQRAFAEKRAKDEEKPTLDHGSKRALHRTLESVHRATFPEHVQTLEEAKSRHRAICDLAGAAAEEDEGGDAPKG